MYQVCEDNINENVKQQFYVQCRSEDKGCGGTEKGFPAKYKYKYKYKYKFTVHTYSLPTHDSGLLGNVIFVSWESGILI